MTGDNLSDPGAGPEQPQSGQPTANQAYPQAEPSEGNPELVEKPASPQGFSIQEYRRQQAIDKAQAEKAKAEVPAPQAPPPLLQAKKSPSLDAKGYLRKAGKMMVFFAVIGGLLLMFAAYMIISTIDRIIAAIGQ